MVGMASALSPGATGDASGGTARCRPSRWPKPTSTLAFPAETEAHGNQLLEPEIAEGIKVFHLIAQECSGRCHPASS